MIKTGRVVVPNSEPGVYARVDVLIPELTIEGNVQLTLAEMGSRTDIRGMPEFWAEVQEGKFTVVCKQRELYDDTTIMYMVDTDGKGTVEVENTNLLSVERQLAAHEIEIIELQSKTEVAPFDMADMVSETFSESSGFNGLVNTDNTTLVHDSDNKLYTMVIASEDPVTEKITESPLPNVSYNRTDQMGFVFTVGAEDVLLTEGIKDANDTASHCSLWNDGVLVATATFSGTKATFLNEPVLSAGETYSLVAHANGGHRTLREDTRDAEKGYPFGGINVSIIGAASASYGTPVSEYPITRRIYSMVGLTTKLATSPTGEKSVEIDLPTYENPIDSTQLICRYSLKNDDTIVYELEDSEGNIDSSLALNTKNSLVNLVSNPIKMRIKLGRTTADPITPTLKTMALKYWEV